jgi:hypothetical protein
MRYVIGYLQHFVVMFFICSGALSLGSLIVLAIIPFLMWDFTLFYNAQYLAYWFFVYRLTVIVSIVVAIWYCTDATTKLNVQKYVEKRK